jgi:uncharacterized protein (UPF0335 family)
MRMVEIINESSIGAREQLREFEDHIEEMEEDNAEQGGSSAHEGGTIMWE